MKNFKIPSGFKDLILGECKSKKEVQLKIEKVLDKWGYKEVETPSVEYYDTYCNGFDEIKEEEMFKFMDNNGKILTLRCDMTLPIARVVATKFKNSKMPLRFRYCASVYKNHKELGGMLNEMTDCGVELIGVNEKSGDLEILVTALESLKVLKKDFTLEIGNVNFFKEAVLEIGLNNDDTKEIAELIGNKDVIALDTKLKQLKIRQEYKDFFTSLVWLSGDEKTLKAAKKIAFSSKLKGIVSKIETLNKQLKELGYDNEVSFDFSKLNKLDYYTGLTFEAYVSNIGFRVLSGGRYDSLIGKFGNELPAVGFSIKLDSLIDESKLDKKKTIKVVSYPDSLVVEALKKASELRKQHIVELVVDNKLKKVSVKEGEN